MENEEREAFIIILNPLAKQKIAKSLKVIKDLKLSDLNIDNTIELSKKFKFKEFKYKLDLTKDIDRLIESTRLIDLAYTDYLDYIFDCYIVEINYSRFIKNNLEDLIEAELPEFKEALTKELKDYLTVLNLSDYFENLKKTKIDTITSEDIVLAMKQMIEEEMVAEYQTFELNLDLIKSNIFRKIRLYDCYNLRVLKDRKKWRLLNMSKTINIGEITSGYYLKRLMLDAEKKKQKLILVGEKSIYRKFIVSDARVKKTAVELVSRGIVELHLN